MARLDIWIGFSPPRPLRSPSTRCSVAVTLYRAPAPAISPTSLRPVTTTRYLACCSDAMPRTPMISIFAFPRLSTSASSTDTHVTSMAFRSTTMAKRGGELRAGGGEVGGKITYLSGQVYMCMHQSRGRGSRTGEESRDSAPFSTGSAAEVAACRTMVALFWKSSKSAFCCTDCEMFLTCFITDCCSGEMAPNKRSAPLLNPALNLFVFSAFTAGGMSSSATSIHATNCPSSTLKSSRGISTIFTSSTHTASPSPFSCFSDLHTVTIVVVPTGPANNGARSAGFLPVTSMPSTVSSLSPACSSPHICAPEPGTKLSTFNPDGASANTIPTPIVFGSGDDRPASASASAFVLSFKAFAAISTKFRVQVAILACLAAGLRGFVYKVQP
mmetsp:Transcript_31470/g.74231  ORF Transcript_31470/g.74231 Transcript_31470/m.74231 type:complete len:386 (-) Transcript_31470:58-1215(-)